MKKIILSLLFIPAFLLAETYRQIYNPETGRGDFVNVITTSTLPSGICFEDGTDCPVSVGISTTSISRSTITWSATQIFDDITVTGKDVCLNDGTNCPASIGGGVTVYPATATASFPYGLSASTGVFTSTVSAQKVGIGTTTPSYPLDVNGEVMMRSSATVNNSLTVNGKTTLTTTAKIEFDNNSNYINAPTPTSLQIVSDNPQFGNAVTGTSYLLSPYLTVSGTATFNKEIFVNRIKSVGQDTVFQLDDGSLNTRLSGGGDLFLNFGSFNTTDPMLVDAISLSTITFTVGSTIADTPLGLTFNAADMQFSSVGGNFTFDTDIVFLSSAIIQPTTNRTLDLGASGSSFDGVHLTRVYGVANSTGVFGSVLKSSSTGSAWSPLYEVHGFTAGDGSTVISTGIKGFFQVPYDANIIEWTLLSVDTAATSCSITVDIWKDTYANYPPTVVDTIITGAGVKPSISSGTKNTSSTLTGWDRSIKANDVLGFNVDMSTSTRKIQFSLKMQQL